MLTACGWDMELMREIGAAIAREALDQGVGLVLGPGANIKRSPLCGRNFEYFSEDPLLTAASPPPSSRECSPRARRVPEAFRLQQSGIQALFLRQRR